VHQVKIRSIWCENSKHTFSATHNLGLKKIYQCEKLSSGLSLCIKLGGE
jgi:hypothetical protein